MGNRYPPIDDDATYLLALKPLTKCTEEFLIVQLQNYCLLDVNIHPVFLWTNEYNKDALEPYITAENLRSHLLKSSYYDHYVIGVLVSNEQAKQFAINDIVCFFDIDIETTQQADASMVFGYVHSLLCSTKKEKALSFSESMYAYMLRLDRYRIDKGYKKLLDVLQVANVEFFRMKLIQSFLNESRSKKNYYESSYHKKWRDLYSDDSISFFPEELSGAAALSLTSEEIMYICGWATTIKKIESVRFSERIINSTPFRLCALALAIEEETSRSLYRESSITLTLIDDFNNISRGSKQFELALPWLLTAGKKCIDNLIVYQALGNEKVMSALLKIANSTEIPIISKRAKSVFLSASGAERSEISDTLVWWSDKTRKWTPSILDAPRSTWLRDSNIEYLLRETARTAAKNLIDIESSSEEHITGSLLQSLKYEWSVFRSFAKDNTKAALNIDYKALTRDQERKRGADIAIIVRINYLGIRTTRIHFVQIKKAKPDSKGVPRWRIDLPQLTSLLETESSSTYWLLNENTESKVICIPAGIVRGLTSTCITQQTATITHSDIRGSSIDIGNHFCDLLVGLWIGIECKEDTMKFISEKYNPSNILSITFTDTDQEDYR